MSNINTSSAVKGLAILAGGAAVSLSAYSFGERSAHAADINIHRPDRVVYSPSSLTRPLLPTDTFQPLTKNQLKVMDDLNVSIEALPLATHEPKVLKETADGRQIVQFIVPLNQNNLDSFNSGERSKALLAELNQRYHANDVPEWRELSSKYPNLECLEKVPMVVNYPEFDPLAGEYADFKGVKVVGYKFKAFAPANTFKL